MVIPEPWKQIFPPQICQVLLIVSDHGAVFRAGDYVAILQALEIEPTSSELRKPWHNLIEAQFKVQLRLADFQFENAQTLAEIQTLHAAFVETFNTTRHWAHQERPDGRRTPAEVLGWVRGRAVDPERLRRLFGQVQCLRTVNPSGFISIHRFYMYAEQGLSRQRVSIWIAEGPGSFSFRIGVAWQVPRRDKGLCSRWGFARPASPT